MIKIDLHIHSGEDKRDKWIKYSAKELIDKAAEMKFNALSFTLHHQFFWKKEVIDYAKKKGILLIPGSEMKIEGKEVLIYNLKKEHLKSVKTLEDLRELKKKNKNIFVMAPHPYHLISICLGKKLVEHIDLFDAIELSWFYTWLINPNKKAMKVAKKYKKPMVATSDCHDINRFGSHFTLLESSKDIASIFNAIRNNKLKIHTRPLPFSVFAGFVLSEFFRFFMNIIVNITKRNKYG